MWVRAHRPYDPCQEILAIASETRPRRLPQRLRRRDQRRATRPSRPFRAGASPLRSATTLGELSSSSVVITRDGAAGRPGSLDPPPGPRGFTNTARSSGPRSASPCAVRSARCASALGGGGGGDWRAFPADPSLAGSGAASLDVEDANLRERPGVQSRCVTALGKATAAGALPGRTETGWKRRRLTPLAPGEHRGQL